MKNAQPIRVLIVDDEEQFRANTGMILNKRGFLATAVGSGIEAIEATKEQDFDVVVLAALFHDIGRPIDSKTGRCHAEIGAEKAEQFLKQEGLTEMISDVSDAILSHRFSKNIDPVSMEAKILQDADALDALGAMGLYRTLGYSFEKGRDLEEAIKHFHEKLFKLSKRMHFPSSKERAQEKEKILHDFIDGIDFEKKNSDFKLILGRI